MAVVQGIKEKVHLPIYDALEIEPGKQFREAEKSSTLKFFVDVQNKTKLLTNLQSASLLPHYNTFEARAMRVVISDLPPEFPEDVEVEFKDDDLNVVDADGKDVDATATATISLRRAIELLDEANDDDNGEAELDIEGDEVTITPSGGGAVVDTWQVMADAGTIEDVIDALEDEAPPPQQLSPDNGAGSLLSKFIYSSVTTFYVGEKVMIEMPTWFFPGGAGPYAETGHFTTHGEPNPTATFRFAEPIYIDKQQNFRVEIDIPDSKVLDELQKIYGPLFIWVVLDGYMTRGVQ